MFTVREKRMERMKESGKPFTDVSLPRGPLSGITVLDLTRVVAGPYCAMLLADLGASVIKIENPQEPDYVRGFPPLAEHQGEKISGFFAQYNRNKLAVSLNLKTERGKKLFQEMVVKADVVIENFRPGTMEKLGLGYSALKSINPRIVYTAISGFGQSGPNTLRPAYDNSAQASGGLWSMNGPLGEPTRVGTIIGDLAASLYGAFGTLAALRESERNGTGQLVDISQQDSVMSLTENAVVNYTHAGIVASPLGDDHPFVRPYGRYKCKDGYIFFGAYTDKFWAEACAAFNQPDLAKDPEIDTMEKRFQEHIYVSRVKPVIEGWFSSRTKAELESIAGDRFPLSPIKTIAEVVNDPHILARGMVQSVKFGAAQFDVFGSPVKLSEMRAGPAGEVPRMGEHNRLVYLDWLGLSEQTYDSLCNEGVI
jgi:CoA:oxalate CoA-transferase